MDYSRIVDRQNKRRQRDNKNESEVNETMSDQKDFLDWVEYYKQGAECKIVLKKRYPVMFEKCKDFVDSDKEIHESDSEDEIKDYHEKDRERKKV